MEGHRRYADEPEPGWYSGQSQYPNPGPAGSNPYDSGVHERPSGAFRLPDQRDGDYSVTSTGSHAFAATDTGAGTRDGVRTPVRGPEYPAVRPSSAAPAAVAPYNEPTGVVPPVGRFGEREPGGKPADSVYRTRRPVSAVVVAVVTVVLLVPAVLLLVEATFGADPTARGIVPAVLLTLGLPLTGVGLYALAGGGPIGREVWLRPPVAYLPVGLFLLLAAGLAVA